MHHPSILSTKATLTSSFCEINEVIKSIDCPSAPCPTSYFSSKLISSIYALNFYLPCSGLKYSNSLHICSLCIIFHNIIKNATSEGYPLILGTNAHTELSEFDKHCYTIVNLIQIFTY